MFPLGITNLLDIPPYSINDRGMTRYEYETAKQKLEPQRRILQNLSPNDTGYEKQLQKYLETLITVKGHAWCMDVATERRKMAKLMAAALYRNND